MNKTLWGIDLGGTKMEGIVLPEENHTQPLCRIRIATEADHGYEHILDQIANLMDRMKEESGVRPENIGFGTPGILDPESGALKNSNTVCLIGKPLAADLENRLRFPCYIGV